MITNARSFLNLKTLSKIRWWVLAICLLAIGAWKLSNSRSSKSGSFDMGTLDLAIEATHEFEVYNAFPEPLVIGAVRSSHPDALIASFDTVIPAHGKGLVVVSVRPTCPGPFAAQFSIDYPGPRHAVRTMALHGDVRLPVLSHRAPPSAEEDLLISASEVLALSSTQDLNTPAIVDLRSVDEFQRAHLPQSLSIPLSQLKAITHLRSRPLVLVNEGIVTVGTRETVESLKKAGFVSVKVLDGGLSAWNRLGSETTGSDRHPLARISASTYLEAIARDDSSLLDVRINDSVLPKPHKVIRLSLSQLATNPNALNKASGPDQANKVLVLTDDGNETETLREALSQHRDSLFYFVDGGAEAVRKQLLQIARNQIPASALKIDASTSTKRASRSVAGCTSCP